MSKAIVGHNPKTLAVMAVLAMLVLALVIALESTLTDFSGARGADVLTREHAAAGTDHLTKDPSFDQHAAVVGRWHQDNLRLPRSSH